MHSSLSLIVFIIFTWAFVLGEYAASQEHGWGIYMANVRKYCSNFTSCWNTDPCRCTMALTPRSSSFSSFILAYALRDSPLERVRKPLGRYTEKKKKRTETIPPEYFSGTAFDILACGACILFPRLAFFAISNNVIVLYVPTIFPHLLLVPGLHTH